MDVQADELTLPERQLWEAFTAAREVDLRTGDPDGDDPAGGADWGPERTIRAEVIAALLLGARETEPGRKAGVTLVGARITGSLELDNTEFECHLRLKGCWFEQRVNLYGARTRQLSFSASHLNGIMASLAQIDGNLRLKWCHSRAEVSLVGTRVSGALSMDEAHLVAADGAALDGNRLQVDNDLLMRHLTAEGRISLRSAHIGGSVQLRESQLHGATGIHAPDHADGLPDRGGATALDAVRLQVGVDFTAYRLRTTGALILRGAAVTGTLFLRAAQLTNPDGRTLDAAGAQIGAGVVLDHGFTADGQIRLAGAETPSRIVLEGARLTAPDT
ncbi:hypothetical protein G5C51_30050, partial [Streptomyces sp. A7024]|nr:hypothetical protein [Streptomyces coryli]